MIDAKPAKNPLESASDSQIKELARAAIPLSRELLASVLDGCGADTEVALTALMYAAAGVMNLCILQGLVPGSTGLENVVAGFGAFEQRVDRLYRTDPAFRAEINPFRSRK